MNNRLAQQDPMRNTLGAMKIAQTRQQMAAQQRQMQLAEQQRQRLAQIADMPEGQRAGAIEEMQLRTGDIGGYQSSRKAKLEEALKRMDMQREQTDMALRGLALVSTQADYDAFASNLIQQNPDLAGKLPAQYTPQVKQQLMSYGMSVKDQLSRMHEQAKFEYDKMHRDEMRRLKASGADKTTINFSPTITTGSMPATKKTINKLQGDLLSGMQTLTSLDQIKKLYDPSFLTYSAKFKNWRDIELEKLGANLGEPDKQQIKRMQRYAGAVNQTFNEYRREITGAAAPVQELQQLKKDLFSTAMGPSQFEGAINQFEDKIKRGLRLKRLIIRNGVPVTEEKFRSEMNRLWNSGADDDPEARGDELERDTDMTEEEIARQLVQEGYFK